MMRIEPGHYHDGLEQSREAFQTGDYKKAEVLLGRLLSVNNREPEIFQMLATIYYDQGKFNKAIKTFRRALEIDPNYTDASVGLSIVMNDIGRYEEGQEVFEEAQERLKKRAMRSDPYVEQKIGKKHAELGELYFQCKRYPEACEQYLKARQMLKDKEALTLRIAEAFFQNGQVSRAVHDLRIFLRGRPQSISARLKLGQMLYEQGEPNAAIEQWENVLMRDPENASARKYIRLAHAAGLNSQHERNL